MKKFLIRHLGNMGDHVFYIPPILATLKRVYPGCHITLVTAWGYKTTGWGLPREARRAKWGLRNQGGFCIHLMMTNPHVDELVHYDDTKLSLDAKICDEDGRRFPTWNKKYYDEQRSSGKYDSVYELDYGLTYEDNPIQRMYETINLPRENYSKTKLYFTQQDLAIAQYVSKKLPRPRIALLEGIESENTRGWDPEKIPQLIKAIKEKYEVKPTWFGSKHIPEFEGRPLTLRENIATLTFCDVTIGVMSGPMHFAAAVGLPTLCLYADQPLHRAAPAYFLNQYISDPKKYHRTLLGPAQKPYGFLKRQTPDPNLTLAEAAHVTQANKTGLAAITCAEVMLVLQDML